VRLTNLHINGEVGPYFKSYKGLRQGDPLSPLLFHFVVDALANILETAKSNGVIHGLVPHLVHGGGVSHLQYADDTVLFVEKRDEDILHLKFPSVLL
jgi:hypothetical protein